MIDLRDEIKKENTNNYSKWNSKRWPKGYNRPGRKDIAEKKYRRGKTHTGKGQTLRDKRLGLSI